jgi:hypothetical protein
MGGLLLIGWLFCQIFSYEIGSEYEW